jgi:hypothetical protein
MVELQEFDEEVKEMARFYIKVPDEVREADKHYALPAKEIAKK